MHTTRYRYPHPVKLHAHKLLLRPREGHDIRIESSHLGIRPRNEVHWNRDVHSNSVAVVSFQEETDLLEFNSKVIIEHYEDAPVELSLDAARSSFRFNMTLGNERI